MTTRTRIAGAACAGLCIAMALASCSSSKNPDGSKGSKSGAGNSSVSSGNAAAAARAKVAQYEATQAFPALPKSPAPKAHQKIFVIAIDLALEGVSRQVKGTVAAINALGWSDTVVDGKSDPTAIAAGLNRAVAESADGIILVAVNDALVPQAVAAARKAGIPIISMTSGSTVGPTGVTQEIVTPAYNQELGASQGDYVVADSGGKAHALVFNDTDLTLSKPISVGAYDVIKACGECTVAPMIDFVSTNIPTTFSEQVRTALVNNPGTNYVVVPFDAAATFAVQGVRAAGMASKVRVVSTGGNLSNLALVRTDNVQTETSAEPLEYFAWLCVDALVRAQAGAPQITFAAPIKVFVRQNAPAQGQAWTGDSDFRSAFLANWGR